MKWDAEKMKSDAEKKELIAQKDAVMYILLLVQIKFFSNRHENIELDQRLRLCESERQEQLKDYERLKRYEQSFNSALYNKAF
jgi:hypothetical protein